MELEKIELLVKKIDHAINIIQKLKDVNVLQEKQIGKLSKENEKIKEENKKLKEENKKQKEEINKTNDLHQKLEEKIQQILQYLPEEDSVEIKGDYHKDKVQQKEKGKQEEEKGKEEKRKEEKEEKEEKDEERLEKLVNEPEQFEKKSLFTQDGKNNIDIIDEESELKEDISKEGLIEEEVVDIDIKQNEENEENEDDFNVNFDDTLLDEEDNNIEFDFEDESGNENKDLPKGVL